MIIAEYRLTSPKIDGQIVFTYHGGVLMSILFRLKKPLSDVQVRALLNGAPYRELAPELMQVCEVQLQRITPEKKSITSTQEKIALFCRYYSAHVVAQGGVQLKYKVSRADSGMIKAVDVTDKLLTTYFTSTSVLFKNHYSIGNYCKFFNQLAAEASGAVKQDKFPNVWSEKFAAKLGSGQLSEYYKHLLSLGLVPKYNRSGDVIDYI